MDKLMLLLSIVVYVIGVIIGEKLGTTSWREPVHKVVKDFSLLLILLFVTFVTVMLTLPTIRFYFELYCIIASRAFISLGIQSFALLLAFGSGLLFAFNKPRPKAKA